MESDDNVLLSSSPVGASPPGRRRKLKRLRKAIRVSIDRQIGGSEIDDLPADEISPEFETLKFGDSEEKLSTGLPSEEFNGGVAMDSGRSGIVGDEDGSGAKRALNFDSLDCTFDEEVEDRSKENDDEITDVAIENEKIGDRSKETEEEMAYVATEEEEIGDRSKEIEEEEDIANVAIGEKQLSPDRLEHEKDKKQKKKRKQRIDGDGDYDEKRTATASNRRRSDKERREYLKQLHAESQRLLRDTRDAAFKPVPLVQKPISSVLEKIRLRKLQISYKSTSTSCLPFIDEDDEFSREVSVNPDTESARANERKDIQVPESSNKDTVSSPIKGDGHTNRLSKDESNDSVTHGCEEVFPMAIDEESKQEFRAPNDDTQDLFSDSQTSDSKCETPSSPLEEVFAPSVFPLKLQLDSEPPDDVCCSSDEEDYDKENVDPRSRRSVELSLSPTGDPAKAFVDDEAEEEDDSDNDLLRFKENEEDEDDDDLEDLKDLIATGYEEKPSDNEKRNELHQKWLKQQDADGTENLLQKFKYGSKVREPTLMEEEEDQESEEDGEFGDEAAEEMAPSNAVKMNLRKVKQMMPQMYTDNDDGYLSSDDEETEKKLAKQCLVERAEERASFFSPAEDESSREIFGRIKKLNIVPDSKKRAKTQTYYDMSLTGVNTSISSKPSFLGRGSSGSLQSSKKQGSMAVRSFIFEREDSNSKGSVSEESSETIQRENRPRTTSAKFISQTMTFTQNSAPVMNSGTSLLDILKRNSFASKRCSVDNVVVQTESMLTSFKLTKKPVKSKEDGNF